jgi:hypothetical protein
MKKTEFSVTYYILLVSVVVLAGVFVSYVGEIGPTSQVVGDFSVSVRTLLEFVDNTVTISPPETQIDSLLGVNVTFRSVANSTGYLHINFTDVNPVNVNVSGKTALGKYTVIGTDLIFTNATLFLNYTDADVSDFDEDSLRVYHYNSTTAAWELLVGSVDEGANHVSGFTTHFSPFGVFGDLTAPVVPPSSDPGGVAAKRAEFSILPSLITASLVQTQQKSVLISIENKGKSDLDLMLSVEGLDGVAAVRDETLFVKSGKAVGTYLDLFALSQTAPGVYIGRLVVEGGRIRKTVNVVVEVRAREALFDVRVVIPPESKEMFAGEQMNVTATLQNIGLRGTAVDVALRFSIMDFDREVLFESVEEMLAVEDVTVIVRELTVPSSLLAGTYVVVADAMYAGTTAQSFDTFEVVGADVFAFPLADVPLRALDFALFALIVVLIFLIIGFSHARKSVVKSKPKDFIPTSKIFKKK